MEVRWVSDRSLLECPSILTIGLTQYFTGLLRGDIDSQRVPGSFRIEIARDTGEYLQVLFGRFLWYQKREY